MTKDRGMGLPLRATEDDFTKAELEQLTRTFASEEYKGEPIQWRGGVWRLVSQSPLVLEEVPLV